MKVSSTARLGHAAMGAPPFLLPRATAVITMAKTTARLTPNRILFKTKEQFEKQQEK
jgi:hypothetical protein